MYLERDDKLDAVFAAQEAMYPVGRPRRKRRRFGAGAPRQGGIDLQTERSDIQGMGDQDVAIPVVDYFDMIKGRSAYEHLVFEADAVFAASARKILSVSVLGAHNTASVEIARYLSKITTEPPLSRDLLVPGLPLNERSLVFDAATVFRRVAATVSSLGAVRSLLSDNDRIAPPPASTAPPSSVFSKSAEPELPLRAEFVPSRQLLDIWIKSLNSYLEEAKVMGETDSYDLFSIADDKRRLEQEFHKRLRGVLVKQAIIYSYSKKVYRLTIGHSFSPTFQSKLSEEFMLKADLGTEFFKLLFEEISAWVRAGRKISGSWGHLAISEDSDLVFYLQRKKVRKVPGFTALKSEKKNQDGEV
ncbi:MAG: hypothetical protein E5X34_29425 [Mesorhizobium sp.]|uniref:hypothetical protein n=1 Tax=Mesorhizobium sp. TaxID=1871066 RepID=UPI0011FA68B8|nr:hypothetical protein [Mesorhizobium sp.]TIR15328.1 MAG: hypothetical protein E5X34_29425 [Mesorhizobium sp.]